MDGRRRTGRFRFWLPALLWLPGGIVADEVLRTGSVEHVMRSSSLVALSAAAPFGLPLALACQRLGRLGYPGPALVAVGRARRRRGGEPARPAARRRSGDTGLSSGLAGGVAAHAAAPRPGIRPLVTTTGEPEVSRSVPARALTPPPGRRQAGCAAGRRRTLPPRSVPAPRRRDDDGVDDPSWQVSHCGEVA
ncbi:MAG: hypothetical protein OXE44_07580, partial [Nitrospinae bacterium]|nr:hypothetical protein [Nitrospinota bacterium]